MNKNNHNDATNQQMAMQNKQHFDVIIVGGGLVGSGFALALTKLPLKIALVEAKLPNPNDARLFALNYHSCQFLKNIGIWSDLKKIASPIHRIHVSRSNQFGAVRLNHHDVQLPDLGHVIPAVYIEQALQTALLDCPNIILFRPATLIALQQHPNLATITVKRTDGEFKLQAPIIIGADGTQSAVRALANIATETYDYQQSAIVTETTLARAHQQIAYERFTDDGAIAMLPLAAKDTAAYRCATIWSAKQDTIARLMACNEQDFLTELQAAFGYRLGKLISIQQRHIYPLRMLRAEKNQQQSIFLLGNAAHTLHPIAAQGFNLSLYEVAALVDGIKTHWQVTGQLTVNALEKITKTIQKQQSISIGLSHRISTYFNDESRLVSFALQLGMLGLERVGFAKRKFVNSMLGRTGSLPSLLLSAEEYE